MEGFFSVEQLKSLGHIINIEKEGLVGKRLHRPGLLAAYCILANLPLGFFLYGLNVYRRGNVWMGRTILILSALAIIGMSITLTLGLDVKGRGLHVMLLNIVVGIGLMKAERSSYQRAISNGAVPAKWWPPLLFIGANILAILFISWLVTPEEEFF